MRSGNTWARSTEGSSAQRRASFRYPAGMKQSLLALSFLLAAPISAQDAAPTFQPASAVEENLRQHRALPDPAEEVWWTETGQAMAWRNRNLHQIVPSVNVYRDGPVSELAARPMAEIADFPVATPSGEVTFDAYLHGEHSTTMGIVILHRGEVVFERYPRMEPHEKPIWWSVTKVFPATLVAILEHRGAGRHLPAGRPLRARARGIGLRGRHCPQRARHGLGRRLPRRRLQRPQHLLLPVRSLARRRRAQRTDA